MTHSLIAQCTYDEIQVALFQDDTLQSSFSESKKTASKQLLSSLQTLLENKKLSLDDISFIGINQGPAPFTTLRVLITTINGLAFANKIPLVGLNGLESMLKEYSAPEHPTLCLYNAFNKDAYFGIQAPNVHTTGCLPIDKVLTQVKEQFSSQPIHVIGHGAEFFKQELFDTFGKELILTQPIAEYPTPVFLHKQAETLFNAGQIQNQVQPLYLKKAV